MQPDGSVLFPRLSTKSGVCVADGYGVRIYVSRRHLVVADGLGRHRRERRFSRATAGIHRLIVLGHEGFVTLEALRWMADVGIAFVQIGREGHVIATSVPSGLNDPRLRRAQSLAMRSPVGIEIARAILREKLSGQAAVLKSLDGANYADAEIQRCIVALDGARSRNALLFVEASAANAYWGAWEHVGVTFARRDVARVAEHWQRFGKRSSPLTGKTRLAANPANAILNYLYSLLEAEARLACFALGLDSGLGVLHADQKNRDSLALDLMEAGRPAVDSYVLKLLSMRTFRASDFHETREGVCRILPPLTHHLAETLPAWTRAVASIAERVAQMLAETPESRVGRVPTRLTQATRRAARDPIRRRPKRGRISPAVPAACPTCGVGLEGAGRMYCAGCSAERKEEVLAAFQASGPDALARLRAEGRDPTTTEDACRKLGAKMAARSEEAWRWDARNGRPRPDPEEFTREILPGLQGVSLGQLAGDGALQDISLGRSTGREGAASASLGSAPGGSWEHARGSGDPDGR